MTRFDGQGVARLVLVRKDVNMSVVQAIQGRASALLNESRLLFSALPRSPT